jgi:hypothetical protein
MTKPFILSSMKMTPISKWSQKRKAKKKVKRKHNTNHPIWATIKILIKKSFSNIAEGSMKERGLSMRN